MGVKGLFSVLDTEPSRYGCKFISDPDEDIAIFIDAPALLYHLISFYKKCATRSDTARLNQPIPPSFQQIIIDHPSDNLGQISPNVIYRLTIAFFTILTDCLGQKSNVHLVFDGVASIYKVEQQVERLQKDAECLFEATKCAQKSTSLNLVNVPHFFAEDAMMKAFMHFKQAGNADLYRVHYAPGEAETYIAQYLRRKDGDRNRAKFKKCLILSNDTDLMIFPSIIGFVPLHTLEYVQTLLTHSSESDSSSRIAWKIHGWEFLRSRYLAAFGVNYQQLQCLSYEENLLITSTISALAGCDYKIESKFNASIVNASKVVLNSSLGGLRQKYRKRCSAKDTVVAVSRFVCHFVSKSSIHDIDQSTENKNGKSTWFNDLVEKMFVLARKHPQQAKKRRNTVKKKVSKKITQLSLQKQKQVLREALYMIYEIYNDPACSKEGNTSIRELNRLTQHNLFFCKPTMTNKVDKQNNLWVVDPFFATRKRIYSLAKCLSCEDISHQNLIVKEYNFFGRESQADNVNIETEIALCREFLTLKLDEIDFLSYLLFGCQNTIHSQSWNKTVENVNASLLLMSLFLSDKDSLMLFLMYLTKDGKTSRTRNGSKRLKNCSISFLETQSRIQIAHFHLRFAVQVLYCMRYGCETSQNISSLFISVDKIIAIYCCNELQYVLWSAVNKIDLKQIQEGPGSIFFSHLVNEIKDKVEIDEIWLETCHGPIQEMWQLRLKYLDKLDTNIGKSKSRSL